LLFLGISIAPNCVVDQLQLLPVVDYAKHSTSF